MTIQYDTLSSTNSLARITSYAVLGLGLAFNPPPNSPNPIAYQPQMYGWEAKLKGFDSSGQDINNLCLDFSISSFNRLYAFAENLLKEQTIPYEFNETFNDSFWDILA